MRRPCSPSDGNRSRWAPPWSSHEVSPKVNCGSWLYAPGACLCETAGPVDACRNFEANDDNARARSTASCAEGALREEHEAAPEAQLGQGAGQASEQARGAEITAGHGGQRW